MIIMKGQEKYELTEKDLNNKNFYNAGFARGIGKFCEYKDKFKLTPNKNRAFNAVTTLGLGTGIYGAFTGNNAAMLAGTVIGTFSHCIKSSISYATSEFERAIGEASEEFGENEDEFLEMLEKFYE
ncbi:MAG: hypothetical protein ABEK17_00580 [Candidatus Aenigmatarchaeota archaeon]